MTEGDGAAGGAGSWLPAAESKKLTRGEAAFAKMNLASV